MSCVHCPDPGRALSPAPCQYLRRRGAELRNGMSQCMSGSSPDLVIIIIIIIIIYFAHKIYKIISKTPESKDPGGYKQDIIIIIRNEYYYSAASQKKIFESNQQ